MRYLSLGEVVRLHQMLLEQSGGANGIRDLGLLDVALAQPRATFGDPFDALVARMSTSRIRTSGRRAFLQSIPATLATGLAARRRATGRSAVFAAGRA